MDPLAINKYPTNFLLTDPLECPNYLSYIPFFSMIQLLNMCSDLWLAGQVVSDSLTASLFLGNNLKHIGMGRPKPNARTRNSIKITK